MTRFHTLALSGLTILGFTVGACDRRAPTADQQAAPSATASPSTPSTTPTTPSVDEKQPVSGHDEAGLPNTATTDLYAVDANGNRIVIRDSAMVTRVQQVLKDSGMYTGPTDGTSVADLSPAVRQFQAKHELAQTGIIDQQTANAMGLPWDKLSGNPDSALEQHTKQLGQDIKDSASTAKDNAAKAGDEIKAGAEKTGDKIDEKTKELGRDIKKGAEKLKEEVHEKTAPAPEPTPNP